MSQTLNSTEGIVLRVIPFRDYDQIVSIFTSEVGLIKVLYKGGRSKRKNMGNPCMPLTKVEVVYREKRGEIFGCHELHCLDMFSQLRRNLCCLEAGCDLLQVVLDSQLIGKEAPLLYALLCSYLKKIPSINNPSILTASFRLKLLKHDGLVRFPFICSHCGILLEQGGSTFETESWCTKHHFNGSLRWDSTELKTIYHLVESQNYSEICLVDLPLALRDKIFWFFKKSLHVD